VDDVPTTTAQVGTSLLHEDAGVRVWLLELQSGQATEWHAHACDYVFVVTRPGAVRCEYIDGTLEEQIGDALGSTQYRARDVPHRLVNVGPSTYQNVVIELKLMT
jgi:quercetin dioxygenase-like cupin family protein